MRSGAFLPPPLGGQIGGMMNYFCVNTLDEIKEYLTGAAVVAFDFMLAKH